MRRTAAYGFLAGGLLVAMSVSAFDFNSLKNAVKNMDVDKVVDMGKRIAASTGEMSIDE